MCADAMLTQLSMGQNPTSGVLSLQRRRDIYKLCCEFDIIIAEDDPYWYLQYPTATAANTTTSRSASNQSFNPDVPIFANAEPHPESWKSSGFPFLDSLVPSYISVDTEGRVIRLDTFSKTVAPGCRLGWITAQPALIERILRITETSTQQPSGFVQSVMSELLLGPKQNGIHAAAVKKGNGKGGAPSGEGWNVDGWVRWLEGLRGNYERRMTNMCTILEDGKYQVKSGRRNSLDEDTEDEWSVVEKTQMYSFDWPVGGMFLWMKMLFETHPLYNTYAKLGQLPRLSRALWVHWTTEPYLVLASPGTIFSPNDEIRARDGWKYYRLCFAAVDEEDLGPVSERLADGVAAFWRIKSVKKIDELLKDDEVAVEGRVDLTTMVGPC